MHRSLPIEAELSSPTTRFSFAGLEFQLSGAQPRVGRKPRRAEGGPRCSPILQTAFARNDFSLRRPCHP
jgi:hypothetical protein